MAFTHHKKQENEEKTLRNPYPHPFGTKGAVLVFFYCCNSLSFLSLNLSPVPKGHGSANQDLT